MLDNLKKYKIKLASNSPRRRELLSGLGIDYEVKLLPGIDETYPSTLTGEEIPVYIAREKADAYRPSMQPDELIITADTIVYIDGEVLGKPKDETEAIGMLQKLSGRSHQVITGVCLTTTEFQKSFASVTEVTFDQLSRHPFLCRALSSDGQGRIVRRTRVDRLYRSNGIKRILL